jgi:coenzyme F420-reducing hydrogenase alpha subunit
MITADTGVEGRLDIRLAPARHEVKISSSRPLAASHLFEGKTIDETLGLVPLLFNVCGQAQRTAAVRAIESAQGNAAGVEVEHARDRLVQLETLREHLWRVLLDWPRFYGAAAASGPMSLLMARIEGAKRAIDGQGLLCTRPGLPRPADPEEAPNRELEALRGMVAEYVLGIDPARWQDAGPAGLSRWIEHTATPAAQLLRFVCSQGWEAIGQTRTRAMPDLAAESLVTLLDGPDAAAFIAEPTLGECAVETGPGARQQSHPLVVAMRERHGQGLITRLAARLVEIARITLALPVDGADLPAVTAPGLAQLEAARGRLFHRVVLDGERIQRYRILAPTEWNFGPQGPAVQALRGIAQAPPTGVRLQAELLIHAIDPCVGYKLDVEPA